MSNHRIGLIIFIAGILFLHTTATGQFLFGLLGLPMFAFTQQSAHAFLGIIAPLGAVAMVIGGIVFGKNRGN